MVKKQPHAQPWVIYPQAFPSNPYFQPLTYFFVTYSWVHYINKFALWSKNRISDISHFHQILNFHQIHPVLLSFFGPCLSSYLFVFFFLLQNVAYFFFFESQKYICTSFVCCYVIEAAEKKVSVEGWMIDVLLCCRSTYNTHTVKKACCAKLPLKGLP